MFSVYLRVSLFVSLYAYMYILFGLLGNGVPPMQQPINVNNLFQGGNMHHVANNGGMSGNVHIPPHLQQQQLQPGQPGFFPPLPVSADVMSVEQLENRQR